ncbi:MAG: DUF7033 domain-containing protein [Bacteroidia bacterium]
MVKVFIDPNLDNISKELKYILQSLSVSIDLKIEIVPDESVGDFIFSLTEDKSAIEINHIIFFDSAKFDFLNNCDEEGFLIYNGKRDYLGTSFYLLTCAQELDEMKKDKFGRFPYSESIQSKLKNCSKNIVQECFNQIANKVFKINSIVHQRTKIFLSHDVDFINGALFQDGFFALKKLNLNGMMNIIFQNLFINPAWLNMEQIMKIESEYDFKSTFYWLVNKGLSEEGIKNSDYDIKQRKIRKIIQNVQNMGWENGIHKSISEQTFHQEIEILGTNPIGNRYHFLKFRPHSNFQEIENANLKFDTSLGFAEELGFRNSYGKPYIPWNFNERRPYSFVECPLNIMDTTLHGYQKLNGEKAYQKIIEFVEMNSSDCVISVLWHNNYFTPYKFGEYFILFKKLLEYFYESKYNCITQTEIVNRYLKNEYINKTA